MSKARVELDEDLHKALSVQATREGMTLKDYVHGLLNPVVEGATWTFLGIDPSGKSVIGETAAKTEKPKVTKADLPKPRLADNPPALEQVARMARAGASLRAIGEAVGYPKATVAENLKRMRAREAAGEPEEEEYSEEERAGEESTGG
ncbi:MAG TPA: helix-turn-helix domain-containing protein [Methanothrix sp.]|jgi:hypothetical protein|nr:helix-turn-helix domain-containing protein [Methanothrix sp.]